MNTFGFDTVENAIGAPGYFVKMVFNESGVVFFRGAVQHRTVKVGGLSYEHDSKGNALAAVITDGRIEIRWHAAYSDLKVRAIIERLLGLEELEKLRDFSVTYQGRRLPIKRVASATSASPAKPERTEKMRKENPDKTWDLSM